MPIICFINSKDIILKTILRINWPRITLILIERTLIPLIRRRY